MQMLSISDYRQFRYCLCLSRKENFSASLREHKIQKTAGGEARRLLFDTCMILPRDIMGISKCHFFATKSFTDHWPIWAHIFILLLLGIHETKFKEETG